MQLTNVTMNGVNLTNGEGTATDQSHLTLQGDNVVNHSLLTNRVNATTTLAGNLDFGGSTLYNQSNLWMQNLTMQGGEITGAMPRTQRLLSLASGDASSTLVNAYNSHSVLTDATVVQSSLVNGSGEASDQSSLLLQGDNTVAQTTIENKKNSSLSLSGNLDFSGSVLNNNATVAMDKLAMQGGQIINNGLLQVNSSSSTGSLINNGNILLSHCPGCETRTLTVNGDYVGNNGTVTVATNLTGGEQRTDKMVITGNASGNTYVAFSNRTASNAPVVDTVKVFETGSSTSGAFVQQQRVVAGGYDYQLQQGNDTDNHNWYLSNLKNGQHLTRPEGGSYTTNLAAAAGLFNTRLADRMSSSTVVSGQNSSSLWLRVLAAHSRGQLAGNTASYTADRSLTQLGGDLLAGSANGKDGYHVGVMAGYGK
ncbi:MAG: Outer membrane protein IcsA autotransporter [Candidatus Erwinia impunctatus]